MLCKLRDIQRGYNQETWETVLKNVIDSTRWYNIHEWVNTEDFQNCEKAVFKIVLAAISESVLQLTWTALSTELSDTHAVQNQIDSDLYSEAISEHTERFTYSTSWREFRDTHGNGNPVCPAIQLEAQLWWTSIYWEAIIKPIHCITWRPQLSMFCQTIEDCNADSAGMAQEAKLKWIPRCTYTPKFGQLGEKNPDNKVHGVWIWLLAALIEQNCTRSWRQSFGGSQLGGRCHNSWVSNYSITY